MGNIVQETNISPQKWHFESMIFLFPRWDMLIPWRVVPLGVAFGGGFYEDPLCLRGGKVMGEAVLPLMGALFGGPAHGGLAHGIPP